MTPATPLVLVVDLDGTIFFIDRTVPGVSREEAIGSSIYNYMPAEHHERIRSYLEKVVEERSSLSYEVPSVGPYGTVLTYETHVGPIEREGEVVALSFVSWEAAPRTADVEGRYHMLADAGMEGLIIHDGTTIVDANEAVCEMFGCKAHELTGQPIKDLFSGRGRSVVTRADFYNSGALHELTARRADGTVFQVEICGKSLPHRSGLSTVIAVRDVSARHHGRQGTLARVKRPEAKTGTSRSKAVDLSDREMDVLELLAQGMTNREVSSRIRVSARTVDHHVSHILAKLGVANRTAAAMAARSKGLLRRKK
jgi:PAS domain S-box-containing protein